MELVAYRCDVCGEAETPTFDPVTGGMPEDWEAVPAVGQVCPGCIDKLKEQRLWDDARRARKDELQAKADAIVAEGLAAFEADRPAPVKLTKKPAKAQG